MSLKYQHSSKTKAAWEALNPVIVADEIVIEKDTNRLKVGDGVKAYSELEYIKTLNYKSYVAKITQANIYAPTVEIIENTIGDIVWTRDIVGQSEATLAGAFSGNTLFMQAGNIFFSWNDEAVVLNYTKISENVLRFNVYKLSDFTAIDDSLRDTIIEIRVYD